MDLSLDATGLRVFLHQLPFNACPATAISSQVLIDSKWGRMTDMGAELHKSFGARTTLRSFGARTTFWENFGADQPKTFKDKRVLEIGCGLGGRSFELAEQGARVLAIDLSESAIAAAEKAWQEQPERISQRVEFRCCPVQAVAEAAFDVAISEDTFEHLTDPEEVLASIRNKLVVGGKAYIGFAPLYHSPYGDHGWIQSALPFGRLPWSHLFLPKRLTFRMMSHKLGQPIKDTVSWPYLALNQLTIREFRALFKRSGMKITALHGVRHHSFKGRLLDVLARIPGLRKYCTDGIYVVLERVR
jgi:SAM-dependent methyltransferase